VHKLTYKTILSIFLLGSLNLNAYSADKQCMPIGGMGLAKALDDTHLVAALSGDMTGANAEITDQKKTETGLILYMKHHFISNRNGSLKTKDIATLTAVPGKDQTYMLEINYNIVDSSGIYADYRGEFHSFGLIKLGKGQVILRYKGEICK